MRRFPGRLAQLDVFSDIKNCILQDSSSIKLGGYTRSSLRDLPAQIWYDSIILWLGSEFFNSVLLSMDYLASL